MDSIWNDDFHHVATVALTGNNEAYYSDYRGSAQEFVSLAKHGFLYQGQYYRWQKKRRGSPTRDVPSCAFVSFLQNHDQIANSIHGRRAHQISSPARYRALTALLIVLPGTPLLFQGQEFAASSPFLYFADREPSLRGTVRHGRRDFLRQFETIRLDESVWRLTDPCDRRTFERCRLDWAEWEEHRPQRLLVQDAIRLRGADPVFSRYCDCAIDGAVLGEGAFVVRVRGEAGEERLIVANLGRRLELDIVPEPLLAPPPECRWRMLWSSERHCYGGIGVVVPEGDAGWLLTADTVHVLKNVSDLGEAS